MLRVHGNDINRVEQHRNGLFLLVVALFGGGPPKRASKALVPWTQKACKLQDIFLLQRQRLLSHGYNAVPECVIQKWPCAVCQVTQYVVKAQSHLKLSHGYTNWRTRVHRCSLSSPYNALGGDPKKWIFFMTLAIRRRTPHPSNGTFPPPFYAPLFSCAIKYYIYETDFTLGLSQKYHF